MIRRSWNRSNYAWNSQRKCHNFQITDSLITSRQTEAWTFLLWFSRGQLWLSIGLSLFKFCTCQEPDLCVLLKNPRSWHSTAFLSSTHQFSTWFHTIIKHQRSCDRTKRILDLLYDATSDSTNHAISTGYSRKVWYQTNWERGTKGLALYPSARQITRLPWQLEFSDAVACTKLAFVWQRSNSSHQILKSFVCHSNSLVCCSLV